MLHCLILQQRTRLHTIQRLGAALCRMGEIGVNRGQADEPIEQDSPSVLSLRRRDQILIGVAAAFAIISIAFYCLRTAHGGRYPIELDQQSDFAAQYRIDLNTATWVEWTQLRGIGQKLA